MGFISMPGPFEMLILLVLAGVMCGLPIIVVVLVLTLRPRQNPPAPPPMPPGVHQQPVSSKTVPLPPVSDRKQ
jgi:hypothetical protein